MTTRHFALGEICSFVGGGTPSRKTPEYFTGDIPWATVKDFKSLTIVDTEEHITEEALENSASNIVNPGTVLLVTRVGLGKVAIAGTRLAINQDIKAVLPNNDDVQPEYLFWLLLSQAKRIQAMGTGATVKGVTLKDVRALRVPVPPLDEQRRIVDLLSRAEGIVRLRREAQAKAAEIIPTLFLHMFGDPASNPNGWPIMPLGDLLVACNYGTSKRANSDGAGVPVLRMSNVNYDGSLDLGDIKHVELDERELARQLLQPGDLLFNRTNSKDLVGKTGLWDGRWPATAASYFIRFRTDAERVRPIYIWSFLNSRHMKQVFFQTARGAIGQSNINMQELRSLMVPVPPGPAQDQFAAHVESLLSINHQQAQAVTSARAALDSLLYRLFEPI